MGHRAPWNRNEEGTALPVVLILSVLLATVVGAFALVLLAERRLVVREVQKTQAAYAAEAGVEAVLARLAADASWRPAGALVDVGRGVPEDTSRVRVRVWVRPYGAFLQVASHADVGRQSARVVALVGREPPEAFDAAVVLGDPDGRLVLAGDATVDGPIWTGPRGWDTGTLGRRPFSGSVRGEHRTVEGSPLPSLDAATFVETIDRLVRAVAASDLAVTEMEAPYTADVEVLRPGPVLRAAEMVGFGGPLVVLREGDLALVGPLELPEGSTVVATGTLSMTAASGRGILLVGDRVRVLGGALQGQALGWREVTVGGGAWWRYPSVLYAHEPLARSGEGGLVVADAWVDGLAVTPERAERGPPSAGEPASLAVQDEATVRGAVYAGRRAEVTGTVLGTLLAREFFFYRSPSTYVGWIDGVQATRDGVYTQIVVPIGMSGLTSDPPEVASIRP